jgi:hypothetical protein
VLGKSNSIGDSHINAYENVCNISVTLSVKIKSEMAWQFLMKDRSPVIDLFLAYRPTDGSSWAVDWYANGSQYVTEMLSMDGSCNGPVTIMTVTTYVHKI